MFLFTLCLILKPETFGDGIPEAILGKIVSRFRDGIRDRILSDIVVWVVFGFGLLHGLGFAALLTQYGLPKDNFISLLLAFNLGVEFGQLAVLLIAFVLIRIILKKDWYSNEIKIPASLMIAAVGLFWFIERVF